MGRSPCCSKEGLNRGAWTALEDKILTDYIKIHGEGKWRNLPKTAGLKRCGKSCRLRWLNYLRPDIKRGNISSDEEDLIIRLHSLLGNRWSLIAGRLPGRTDNEIKNYWNTNLRKKVQAQSNSTSNLKSQMQQDKKKKPKIHRRRPPSPAPAKIESQVVRTKAMRCTKVVLNNGVIESKTESESINGLSSFTQREASSSDFMADFNVGEFCLSDLLDSNFLQLCNFDNNNGETNDQPLVLNEERIESVEPEIASDYRSLDWFLHSEEDWLGE